MPSTLKDLTGKAPWYVEPAGLEEIMRLWGFTMPDLEKYRKELLPHWIETHGYPGNQFKCEQFKGDSVAAFIRKKHKETGIMPRPLRENADPAQETYLYLERMGFEVWIPGD